MKKDNTVDKINKGWLCIYCDEIFHADDLEFDFLNKTYFCSYCKGNLQYKTIKQMPDAKLKAKPMNQYYNIDKKE